MVLAPSAADALSLPDALPIYVVGQRRGELQHVVTDAQATQRYGHAGEVREQEETQFPALGASAFMTVCPIPVAEPRDDDRDSDGECFCCQGLLGGAEPLAHCRE